ncbi:flagellar assembly protein FliH [Glaciecola sp. 1036]|uniref:flagellar assembly protein FliH n=1 Tax=Alteromonadaceae TaxID=72275 RepID=UPI003D0810A9
MTQADDKTEFSEAKLWNLPSVDDALAEDDAKTNALNKPYNKWKYEPPEEEEDVRPLTAEDIEAIRKSAYQEGFEQGQAEGKEAGKTQGYEEGKQLGFEDAKQAGFEEGMAQAEQDIQAKLAELTAILEQLHQPFKQVTSELKKELTLLTVTMANAIVGKQIEHDESLITDAIEKGIATLPLNDLVTSIHLHPSQISTVQAYLQDFSNQPQHNQEMHWQLVPDESMAKGGCKITTKQNAVDLSIKRRSEQVISQVLLAQGINNDPRAD